MVSTAGLLVGKNAVVSLLVLLFLGGKHPNIDAVWCAKDGREDGLARNIALVSGGRRREMVTTVSTSDISKCGALHFVFGRNRAKGFRSSSR